MFDCFFGWRKASKCKKLIRRAQGKLKLLKTKRQSIAKQLREDVAQLIKIGYEDLAFKRVEQIFKDQNVLPLYDLLENNCEIIISLFPYIWRTRDLPDDINKAVSTLIFASARCCELPELKRIRELFRERYGERFVTKALELLPGNLVNLEVKEKLSIKPVTNEMKQKLLQEIAKDNCLQHEILVTELATEFHQQTARSCKTETSNPDSHQDDTISTVISSLIIEQCSTDVTESPVNCFEAVCAKESGRIQSSDRMMKESSSDSMHELQDKMIVYLDDKEELKHCTEKEGMFQDDSRKRVAKELYAFPATRRSCVFSEIAYNQLSTSHWDIALDDSTPKTSSPSTRKTEKPPYLRAITMQRGIEREWFGQCSAIGFVHEISKPCSS